jgi:hypothetical protein
MEITFEIKLREEKLIWTILFTANNVKGTENRHPDKIFGSCVSKLCFKFFGRCVHVGLLMESKLKNSTNANQMPLIDYSAKL